MKGTPLILQCTKEHRKRQVSHSPKLLVSVYWCIIYQLPECISLPGWVSRAQHLRYSGPKYITETSSLVTYPKNCSMWAQWCKKTHYITNNACFTFKVPAILKHKEVTCMRRKILFTVFFFFFFFWGGGVQISLFVPEKFKLLKYAN